MDWRDDRSNLDHVCVETLLHKRKVTPRCCDAPSVHLYAHRFDDCRAADHWNGSAWIWCSTCGAFSHLDGLMLPDDWKNHTEIGLSELTAVPRYLEEIKGTVDLHLQRYLYS